MTGPSPPSDLRPHPLAAALCERLDRGAVVLELGTGRGRNTRALRGAGLQVIEVTDTDLQQFKVSPQSADAALSTHGFLHGSVDDIARLINETANVLRLHGVLYATFASTRDSRFGKGKKISDSTFAPDAGDEMDVAHSYFDEDRLLVLLRDRFVVESLTEEGVDMVVGQWAHAQPPSGTVHWFVQARLKS